jgi:hypothetical protein
VGSVAGTMRGARNEQPEEETAERGVCSAGKKLRNASGEACARRKKLRNASGEACAKNTMVS